MYVSMYLCNYGTLMLLRQPWGGMGNERSFPMCYFTGITGSQSLGGGLRQQAVIGIIIKSKNSV